jgi:hypothetical protein
MYSKQPGHHLHSCAAKGTLHKNSGPKREISIGKQGVTRTELPHFSTQ